MTSKHTPGPWRATPNLESGSYGPSWAIRLDKQNVIANVSGSALHRGQEQAAANARLIAAAPDLLAELERMYEAARCMADPEHCLHNSREYLPWRALADQAKAAIVKAKAC